ncbi:MAG: serine acetyltransferase [Cyanobacteria bacterium RI_101]|nr:serine acetyltransferase [Cyanobacteria bacterium RI_101]
MEKLSDRVRVPPSATEPDWSRERLKKWWEPNKQLIKSLRGYQKWQTQGLFGKLVSKYYVLLHRFWSIITGADIPINCQLSGGLILRHPNGVVISPRGTMIGPNCIIFQQVTIVSHVKIGGNVLIGAGAKIIRPVTVGDNAHIGANAVVLQDVPPDSVVAGIPAKIIKSRADSDEPII